MSRSREELADLVRRGYRFAYSLTHESARADDLVQDAWLAILRARGPWTIEYLIVAIRNRFVDQCRREGLVRFSPLQSEDGQVPDDAGTASAMDAMVAAEAEDSSGSDDSWIDVEMLEPALATLRAEERAVLYLAVVEERSASAIGELLGWPRGTVLSLIHRARGKLRASLRCEPGART
jgi:RNA polymerase sigma factor (sigma-70 family)